MDPITIISLLVSSGLLTQVTKFGFGLFGKKIPNNLVPLLSGGYGMALGQTPVFNVDPTVAALLGLGATGAHQAMMAHQFQKIPGAIKSWFLPWAFPMLLTLGACSQLQSFVQNNPHTAEACQAIVILAKAVGSVRADVLAIGPDATEIYDNVAMTIAGLSAGCSALGAP